MRKIGHFSNQIQAQIFSDFLKSRSIDHYVEKFTDQNWGSESYGEKNFQVWIYSDDQFDEAKNYLFEYIEQPNNTKFFPPVEPQSIKESFIKSNSHKAHAQPIGIVTKLILIICTSLLILTSIEKNRDSKGSEGNSYLVNIKINKALMYDYPLFYQRLSNYLDLKKYIDDDSSPKKISQLKQSEENLLNTDYWQGLYTYLPSKNFTAILTTPKFEKIREGQVYRLVTPAFLHADVFHLFFNMLWLLVLGKQIEEKIKPFKYILLIIALATFSNTVQYLITGPNFLGFSGVLCGMLTFVWMRAKVAPWEGYDIDKWTFLSLMGFIVAMSILQLVSLLLNLYFQINLPLSIANSAHLSGAFGGYLLAKHKFFRWSHSL